MTADVLPELYLHVIPRGRTLDYDHPKFYVFYETVTFVRYQLSRSRTKQTSSLLDFGDEVHSTKKRKRYPYGGRGIS